MNSGGKTHPVGEKLPNGWGLYDMHGNVGEWGEDVWHDTYAEKPEKLEKLKSNGGAWTTGHERDHVVRGGSWGDDPLRLRSACRNDDRPASGATSRFSYCQNAHLLNLYPFTSFALLVGGVQGL